MDEDPRADQRKAISTFWRLIWELREELPGIMGNRERWKTIVDSAQARLTE